MGECNISGSWDESRVGHLRVQTSKDFIMVTVSNTKGTCPCVIGVDALMKVHSNIAYG